ncbi:hypothetical protein H2198_003237 [Neophaeococcomyces mojaviensis]|uniref:Uncharacterized protein n=1 Tax=Neophaeococcomyces mojaviensis TaxID=3383035 RepID=A0ACC3ACB8_9EURO|nr:hypothetical protein H2198_003237 [Knufia sp. JES_112]
MTTVSRKRRPNSLQPFCYQPLNLNKPSLRLIEVLHVGGNGVLVCELRHAETTEEYIALSYMWGPEIPYHDIKLVERGTNRKGLFRVRSNLYGFLLRAASSEVGTSFWIDAICINQQNVQERNHQVRQMGSIYRNASEVRIWLGEDLPTGEILSAMSTISHKGDLRVIDLFDKQLCPVEFRATFQAEKRAGLLKNEYWSRTWIVQEVMLAARITVQSAHGKTSWSNLAGLYTPHYDEQSPFMQKLVGHWRAGDNLDISDIPRQYPINFLLSNFGETKCADSRDHLYSLLALVVDGDKLEVDYTETPAQLLVRATKTLKLDAGDLRPLLPALNFDAKSLFAESGIHESELWKTQKVLSQIRDVLNTKRVFPACLAVAAGQCEWSKTGHGTPCAMCCEANNTICDMPECLQGWQAEARRLIEVEDQVTGAFSVRYRSYFKEWLCSIWPDFLAGPHTLSDDHCEQCFACGTKKRIQERSDEWRNMERSLQESRTGHRLPSLDNWLAVRSGPNLRMRRAGRPLALGSPPPEGPKLAAEATAAWAELFKGTARVEGWK